MTSHCVSTEQMREIRKWDEKVRRDAIQDTLGHL